MLRHFGTVSDQPEEMAVRKQTPRLYRRSVAAEKQKDSHPEQPHKDWERDTRRGADRRSNGGERRGNGGDRGGALRRRRGEVDADLASRAVQQWQASGPQASDEKSLRRTLRRRALLAALGMLFQTAVDLAAAWGGFTLAAFLSIANSVPHHNALSFVAAFIGAYYLAGAVFDTFTFISILFTALRFKVDSSALMQTTKANAGESGLDLVNKGNQAISAAKTHAALGDIQDMLQDEGGSLQGLGDHLAAKHAQERRRAQLGGGDWGQRDTAAVSDLLYKGVNDGLDYNQVQELIDDLNIGRNRGVSEPRLQQAFNDADADHDGVIDLGQFVDIYQHVY